MQVIDSKKFNSGSMQSLWDKGCRLLLIDNMKIGHLATTNIRQEPCYFITLPSDGVILDEQQMKELQNIKNCIDEIKLKIEKMEEK